RTRRPPAKSGLTEPPAPTNGRTGPRHTASFLARSGTRMAMGAMEIPARSGSNEERFRKPEIPMAWYFGMPLDDRDPTLGSPDRRERGEWTIDPAKDDDDRADCDRLELPPSWEPIGRIMRVAGHRVSLFHILDAIFDGTSTERLREMFPTIPGWKLGEVVAFCERNIDHMRRHHGEQRAAFAAAEAGRRGEAPTLA